jgi:hypothetical protein
MEPVNARVEVKRVAVPVPDPIVATGETSFRPDKNDV